MPLADYDGLKASIADHLERDDLADQIDDFIDLAEARHKREIRIREMLVRDTLSIAADAQTANLPSGFLDLKYMRIQAPTSYVGRTYLPDVVQVTIDQMTEVSRSTAGVPKWYCVHTQFEFDRPADQAYTADIGYYSAFTPLSDANTTNDLLTRAPGVYLYGSLAAAAPYLMHDERIPVWERLYANERDTLNTSDIENTRGTTPIARVQNAR